jgi:hypothetical protein
MKTLLFLMAAVASAHALTIPDDALTKAFAGRAAALVIEECNGGAVVSYPDDGVAGNRAAALGEFDRHAPALRYESDRTRFARKFGPRETGAT